MAKSSAWNKHYQTALSEYGSGSYLKLDGAIAECIFALRVLPSKKSEFTEKRRCLTALSDLLVLRVLHRRYEATRMTADPLPLQKGAAIKNLKDSTSSAD
jgi:hypothetical protein